MKVKQWWEVCKDTVKAWVDDFAPSMGAAISYYTMFSLAPLLVLIIAIAGVVFGAEAVRGQIASQLSSLMGQDTAKAIEGMIESASTSDSGWWASALSLVVLLIGATSVFAELQSALDRIWHVPESKKPSGLWGLLRARLFSFGLILGLAFLLMVSLAVSAGLAAFGTYLGGLLPGQEMLLQALNVAVSLSVLTVLFAMIFKLMPTVKVAWRDVWIGAVVTAVLFEIGKMLIGLYLGKSSMADSFAGAGALVILLAWVYYAAQIFLLGAEFTKVYAYAHGSAQGREVPELAGEVPTRKDGPDTAEPASTRSGSGSGSTAKPASATTSAPSPTSTTTLHPAARGPQVVTVSALNARVAQAGAEALPHLVLLGVLILLRGLAERRVPKEIKRLKSASRRAARA